MTPLLQGYAREKIYSALQLAAVDRNVLQIRTFWMRGILVQLRPADMCEEFYERLQKHLARFPAERGSPAHDVDDKRWKKFTKSFVRGMIEDLFSMLAEDDRYLRKAVARWADKGEKPAAKKAVVKQVTNNPTGAGRGDS